MKKYPLNDIPYFSRFCDMIDGFASLYGDSPALSWFTRKQEKQTVSFNQLREDVYHLQAEMIRRGLAGKHLAIVSENSYEWLLVYFAAAYCGSVAICVDIEQSEETILQMLETADTDAVFHSSAYRDICSKFAGETVPTFIMGVDTSDRPTVREMIASGKAALAEGQQLDLRQQVTPDHTASIVFTSGTTNQAKLVMLSQSAILTNAGDAMANVKTGNTVFTALPFYHTYGLTCAVIGMLLPGSQVFINGNLKTMMRDLLLSQAHTVLTVPLVLETIHNRIWATAEENGKADGLRTLLKLKKMQFSLGIHSCGKTLDDLRTKILGNVQLIICGGARMDPMISEEFHYLGISVIQGYGITECAPLVSVNRNLANKWDSVGLVSAHSEVKLVDGEILVRGKNLMQGYYKQPELTDESMMDGWFCTGDLGEIDKDGFLYITGRKKNLIVLKNGKKISPEKLEEKLKQIPLVQDVMVYGTSGSNVTDDVQVAASIYPDREKTEGMTNYEILEQLQAAVNKINDNLPIYQQIQMVTIREQEFSKTSLKKIKRHLS